MAFQFRSRRATKQEHQCLGCLKILMASAFVVLATGSACQAEMILAHYEWMGSPNSIGPDGNGTGKIFFGAGLDSSLIPYFQPASGFFFPPNNVPYLGAVLPASPNETDTYTNKAYTLSLRIIDKSSLEAGTMYFTGLLNGSYSQHFSHATNTFTSPTTQQLRLGQDLYRVTMGAFNYPGGVPFGRPPIPDGWIGVHFEASPIGDGGPPASNSPEPSAVALALAGVSSLLFGSWRWRRRETAG